MKLMIVGSGYVGLITGTCFADLGNDVICVDIDKEKIDSLSKGVIPIYEPALKELVDRNLRTGRLKFSTNAKEAINDSEIIFICVGTPPKQNGEADMKYVYSAAETIGKHINDYRIIINKSTVPVGTAEKVSRIIADELKKRKEKNKKKIEFDVVSNPEFLREGAAVKDFQNPDRIVIGTSSERAKEKLSKLYKPLSRTTQPIMFTEEKNAELIKYASNAMLTTRISFMNELSHLCEAIGANIKEVAKGMGLDKRIGPRFLQAGCGYGGSCFPKDVKALAQLLEQHGQTSNLLRAVDYINERQKKSIVPKLKKNIPKLEGKTIAIWGLSFKPRTDDVREAPSITIIEQLIREYAKVKAYDPEGMKNAKILFGNKVVFADEPYSALENADALLILTEWDEFREPDFERMKKAMKQNVIIDGRNLYDPKEMKQKGIEYQSVGR